VSSYQALGLRCNPFGGELPEEEPALVLEGPVVEALLGQQPVVQLLGPRGAGKTSHLRHLVALVEAREGAGTLIYQRVEEGQAGLPPLPREAGWLVVDEACRLGWRARRGLRRWLQPGRRLRMACHRDLGGSFRGLTVETLALTPLGVSRLEGLLRRRLELAALPGTPPRLQLEEAGLEALRQRSGGRPYKALAIAFEATYLAAEEGVERITGELVERGYRSLPEDIREE